MITNFKIIFVLLILASSCLFAQESIPQEIQGSFNLSIPPEILEYQMESTNFYSDLYKLSFNKSFLKDTTSAWMRARIMIGAFGSSYDNYENSQIKMLSPLYNNYLDSQKYSALKSILGAVQLGAVGYLAYKHLKKYGFLKKK